jgi:integrase
MVERLRLRRSTARPNKWDVVFTSPLGGLRDPSNTQADLRVIFEAAGYGWVTSHVYRKTVATMMDASGLTARQAADQLGHAKWRNLSSRACNWPTVAGLGWRSSHFFRV